MPMNQVTNNIDEENNTRSTPVCDHVTFSVATNGDISPDSTQYGCRGYRLYVKKASGSTFTGSKCADQNGSCKCHHLVGVTSGHIVVRDDYYTIDQNAAVGNYTIKAAPSLGMAESDVCSNGDLYVGSGNPKGGEGDDGKGGE